MDVLSGGNGNLATRRSSDTCQVGHDGKIRRQQSWQGGGGGGPRALLVGMTGAAAVDNSTEVPQKAKKRITMGSRHFTAEYIPPITEIGERYLYTCVPSSTSHNG